MKNFPRPKKGSYPEYYDQYLALVPTDLLIEELNESHFATQSIMLSFNNKYGDFKYAEEKWSIKQVLMHIADTERILQYRILCIARGEKNQLPGFDENEYAVQSFCDERTLDDILEEMSAIRHATTTLLQGLHQQVWLNEGSANNKKVNVAAIAYMICGHEIHHRKVITDRYVSALLNELKDIKQQPT